MTMKLRHMYMLVSFCGHTCLHYTNPPREVRESFEGGEGVSKGVTQFTNSGAFITTAWTTALICDDEVWVRVTHPYTSDEPMISGGTAKRLAYSCALEAECTLPDAMTAITGGSHI